MYRVEVDGKVYTAKKGALLSSVLMNGESRAEHPCGGKGICKKCTVRVNGKEELSCQYVINSDIAVEIPEKGQIESVSGVELSGAEKGDICFCLDIGTTTLTLATVSLETQNAVNVITRNNPQRVFGADVISRIEHCMKNGHGSLHRILTDEINRMIISTATTAENMYVSGNTTMLHLFFGEDCSTMGMAPYIPAFLESRRMSGSSLGIKNVQNVESLPCVHAFVGADIVAGLNCMENPSADKYNILLDLGTNAEIALVGEDKLLCTSAAAGPCFEGANISCGMSATEGAIYSYRDGLPKTVGGKVPKGICGTGLVDVIAYLLKTGIADETGYMEESFNISSDVYITQEDIRQYQLAKSAVYSGIVSLVRSAGISFDDIEMLYISGGFSHKINTENAVRTGLLPKELSDRCHSINNSSLSGTVKYALGKRKVSDIIRRAEYIDLSSDSNFSELFINNMSFDEV